ncbi:MAG TPA: TIGR02996 domain-containing protein [Urbifossiella sp.]|nr:TIGR02996 domain-containing protein [Urbifossiella sp.]
MDVQAALLAAIADRPDDDTPRLVYADWLDDHAGDAADPDAARARAEFIRVQCAVKQLGHLPSADHQAYVDLYRRQDALLTHHRRALLGPLADELGPHDAVFDRGFVTELRLDTPTFVRHAETIAALARPPAVVLSGVARHLDQLSEVSHLLPVVTTANMQSPRWPEPQILAPDEVWSVFVECWPWDGLRELNMEGCRIGDEGLARLVGQAPPPSLTRLDVSGNEISDEGIRELVASPLWPRLHFLVLGANPISDEGAFALADAPPTAIEYLNLKYTGLTPHGQQRVLRRKGWKVDLF